MRLPLLLVAVLAAAGPDDASVAHYNLDVGDVRDALFIDVTSGDFWTPPPSPALRALDGAGRVAAARTFAAFAKAYTATSDFQNRYAKWRTHELGEVPAKPPSYEDYSKEQAKLAKKAGTPPAAPGADGMAAAQAQQMKQMQAQIDQAIKGMSPEQQEQLKQMQAQMDAASKNLSPEQQAQLQQMAQASGTAPPDTKMDKATYEQTVIGKYKEDKAAYDAHLAKCPEKPSAAVKAALQHFLAATADVDFSAKLVDMNGHHVFADNAMEAKPDVWKRAFRAGKDTTTAVRQAAQSWLGELK